MTTSRNGNTLLHDSASTAVSYSELCNVIANIKAQYGEKALQKMARTINDVGDLPYNCVRAAAIPYPEKGQMMFELLLLAITHDYKNITTQIDQSKFNKIVKQYNIDSSSQLFTNLTIAHELVNEVRTLLHDSWTHPDFNNYTELEQKTLFDKIQNDVRGIKNKLNDPNNLRKFENDPVTAMQDLLTEHTIKLGVGNCREYVFVALSIAKQKYPGVSAEAMLIENGDHIFLVIGTGNDRVVCDPWAGKIYPFSQIEKELKGHIGQQVNNKLYNICTFFNPKHHKILPAKPAYKKQVEKQIENELKEFMGLLSLSTGELQKSFFSR